LLRAALGCCSQELVIKVDLILLELHDPRLWASRVHGL
jgi:hypothetical protein